MGPRRRSETPPRRRGDSRRRYSRSPSRRRSPPRRRRSPSRRSRSRGDRRGGKGGKGKGGGDVNISDWGNKGTIVDMKGSGFGFIRPVGGQVDGKDLYFHNSVVVKPHAFDELRMHDEVTYSVGIDERRGQPTAKDVTPVGGDGGGGGGGGGGGRGR